MQKDYDLYGEKSLKYSILTFSRDYTEGGVGMWGYKQSSAQVEKMSEKLSGENNPGSKLTNKEFYELVDFLKKGYTNQEIAELYGLHDRYVSLIRHKKRFKRLWDEIDYTPKESTKGKENRNLTYDDYLYIREMIDNGTTNANIENIFKLSSGTGSRLRHGKLYGDFYTKYINEK